VPGIYDAHVDLPEISWSVGDGSNLKHIAMCKSHPPTHLSTNRHVKFQALIGTDCLPENGAV